MYYSQFSQDKIINTHFVKNKRDGYFVDVGAHNGVLYSNTYFFEKELNWRGICVEPIQYEYEKLKKARKSININACAYSEDGEILFNLVEDKQSPGAHSYNMLSGIVGNHSTKNRVAKFGLDSELIEVPCVQLKTLFEKYKIETVDYLSIDTEGSELEVLKGIDFSKVHINLIDLEHNSVPKIVQGAEQILTQNNFDFVGDIYCDALYVNKTLQWSWGVFT